MKYTLYAYIWAEVLMTMKQHNVFKSGFKELYTLFVPENDFVLDYTDYIEAHKATDPNLVNFKGFDHVESIYVHNNMDSPVNTWLHQ